MINRRPHIADVKNRIFKMVLWISIFAFFIVAITNAFNKRPLSNFMIPFASDLLICLLLWLFSRNKFKKQIKYGYMTFLCVIYLPTAWLTSPGSYSAMSFYAILIIFVGIILAQEWWDYGFSIISVIEVLLLLNYEPRVPDQYRVYSEPSARALDLSVNFLIASIVMFAIVIVLNNYFDSEHKRIYKHSITDPLTGIYNRRYLFHQLENFKSTFNQGFTLLMMDLNSFKNVNDTYGHVVGDEVLREFGKVLNQACRQGDLPARYGGDEFIIVLFNTKGSEVEIVKNRIDALFMPIMEKYKDTGLSVGYGIAESNGLDIETIMQIADNHLYKNKEVIKKKNVL
ncbi:MAG TPA: GGDEF domain-containing protein [Fusibacter sp.]|nr:GGDEF domain-containing protein [Fusibacter sp.]